MLGCGGGGDGLEALLLAPSRLILGAALVGGGISELATLFELDVATKGCLDAGLLELAREAFRVGVAEADRDSPIVIKMNSLNTPSSV